MARPWSPGVDVLPCVILAGGLGTRMRPLTERIPKALIPVRGRPFAELQLEWLAAEGVEHVLYSVGYRADLIREALGSGERFGLRIEYVDEGDDLRGSGGALRLALDLSLLPEQFFVVYGDAYLSVSLAAVERRWRASDKPALMTVLRNAGRWDRSNVVLLGGSVFYDKRAAGEGSGMEWIDYGLSVTRADVIAGWLPPGGRGDLADLFHLLSRDGDVAGFEVTDRFYEIGSPAGLKELEDHLGHAAGQGVWGRSTSG
jgi:NDP-sugar pyrophosphorylase family protein